ncbi:hypothetical protein Q1695_001976 [Nippostrongylus brasiliensis]|nr:hypothetical protein Q1695_001976 [Nippostrongylus brasiliensis]
MFSSPSRKRPRKYSDEDASFRSDGTSLGVEYEDEHEEYDECEEQGHSKDDLIAPNIMLEQLNSFRDFVTGRGKLDMSWSRMKTLFDEWFKQEGSDAVDSEALMKSFKRYLSSSLKPTMMSMDIAFKSVNDYLERPSSVLLHPDFPSKPPTLLHFYCKKFGIVAGFGKIKEAVDRMKDDNDGRTECEKELVELEKSYVEKMEDFLSNHREALSPNQQSFIENRIKVLRRKLFPSQRTPKGTPRARNGKGSNGKAKEEKTAFELFCSTKQDKYTDLPEETRLKKLKKKFDKLEDDKKEIFEKLALLG